MMVREVELFIFILLKKNDNDMDGNGKCGQASSPETRFLNLGITRMAPTVIIYRPVWEVSLAIKILLSKE
jgi:hypothetical protein